MPKNQHDIITTTEVAKLLRIDARTVQRKATTGELPTVSKLPGETGAYLFDRATILTLATPTARPVDDLPPVSAGRASSFSLPVVDPNSSRSGN